MKTTDLDQALSDLRPHDSLFDAEFTAEGRRRQLDEILAQTQPHGRAQFGRRIGRRVALVAAAAALAAIAAVAAVNLMPRDVTPAQVPPASAPAPIPAGKYLRVVWTWNDGSTQSTQICYWAADGTSQCRNDADPTLSRADAAAALPTTAAGIDAHFRGQTGSNSADHRVVNGVMNALTDETLTAAERRVLLEVLTDLPGSTVGADGATTKYSVSLPAGTVKGQPYPASTHEVWVNADLATVAQQSTFADDAATTASGRVTARALVASIPPTD